MHIIKSILLLFLVGLISCQMEKPTATKSNEVADLIQRSEKIQLGKEWEYVQNAYAKNKLIIEDTNDPKSRIELAQLFIKEARVTGEHGHYYPAALEQLNQAINNQDISQDLKFIALTTKAGVELSLHEFAIALSTAEKAYAINSINAQIQGVLVDCYVELGRYSEAVKMADQMVNLKPDIRSYSRISYLREIHGDIEGAIDAMTMAAKSGYPGYEETAWSMQTLAELLMKYERYEAAESVLKTLLETRADYPFAVAALGDINLERGKFLEAEKKYKEAIDIIPEVGFYISLASLYKEQQRQEEFDKLIDEIHVMIKDDVDHGHNMNLEYADLYLELLDKPTLALEYAQKEYEKRPKNIDVNRALAKIYINLDKRDKVEQYASVAEKISSKHPELDLINRYLNN